MFLIANKDRHYHESALAPTWRAAEGTFIARQIVYVVYGIKQVVRMDAVEV
jgi:hypothetical protein